MKLTTLILLLAVLTTTAGSVYSQNARFNLKMKDASIVDVFREIERTSEFGFFFKNDELDLSNRISVDLKNATIEEVLKKILTDEYSYKIIEKNIIVTREEKYPTQQPKKSIKGTVTDPNGNPIPGVSITVKGSASGTISNADGNYTLQNVPSDAIILFSFVGMKNKEESVSGKSTINVRMEDESISIDEVVAVGYGTTKKKDLTSSITTVNSKDFNQGAHTDVMQLLQGKVPGLNITKDGNPSGAAAVMLRGPSTLRAEAQQPLYVVDGVPGGIISSMDDVVSIDILRDASATSIYGSRAANGVIIITTKRGEENSSKISYNAFMGIESVSNKIDMMSPAEYRAFLSKNNLSPIADEDVNTDWFKECTRLGISHNNNLSIGGGTGKTTYFASASYKDVEGIIKRTYAKTFSVTGNVQQKALNDRLKIGITITNTILDNKLLPSSNTDATSYQGNRDFLLNMINYLPTVNVKESDGSYYENTSITGAKNPVALLYENDIDHKTKTFLAGGHIQYNVMKGLDWEMNGSYQNTQYLNNTYFGKNSMLAQGYNGLAIRKEYQDEMKLFETFASYGKTINRHDFKVMVGYSWQETKTGDGFQLAKYSFLTDGTSYNNLTLGNTYDATYSTTNAPVVSTLRMISGYARFNYSFANKYLLQATVRRDGSSAFGENNRWGTFPSGSVGWRIIEEPFMKSQRIFDNLKLRAGYGISGNSLGFDPLISKLRYSTSGKFYYQGSYITSIVPGQDPNPNLKWEKTGMVNVGLDFSVLKGRLSGTVEYYDKTTKDLIYYYPVSASQYYGTTFTANVGEMENKGWEVTINAVPYKSDKILWNTTFNLSFNKNNVISLSNDQFQLDYIKQATSIGEHGQSGNFAQIIEAGHPIGQFYLWDYQGRNSSNLSQFTAADGTLTTAPGGNDHFFQGNAQPKMVGGWFNSVSYKRFNLDCLFRFVTGNHILNATRADLNYPAEAAHYNMLKMTADEPIGDTGASFVSTRYLEKGDYLRLDNVTLSYTFKMKSQQIKNLRLYSTVNNVFVITGYKGIDPEVYMGGLTPGIDNDNFYPKTRTFIFGVNVDF